MRYLSLRTDMRFRQARTGRRGLLSLQDTRDAGRNGIVRRRDRHLHVDILTRTALEAVDGRLASLPVLAGRRSAARHKVSPSIDGILLRESEIKIKNTQKLTFHVVHFTIVKVLSISRPMLVLWRGVVQIFGRNDKGRQKDAVSRARHACVHL